MIHSRDRHTEIFNEAGIHQYVLQAPTYHHSVKYKKNSLENVRAALNRYRSGRVAHSEAGSSIKLHIQKRGEPEN